MAAKAYLTQPKRRDLLQAAMASFVASATPVLAERIGRTEQRFLAAFVDTMLPETDTPGAITLGSGERLLARAAADQKFEDIMLAAIRAVDGGARQLYGSEFADLDMTQRGEIFARLDLMPDTELLGWFFKAARADIFFHYYAQLDTLPVIGLSDTPQPYGHPDAQEPWRPQ